jgi:aminoglycoside 2''-phosphotransferase
MSHEKRAARVRLVREAHPDLPIESAELREGGGQFNDILLVNGELIFRFPRSEAAARTLAMEVALLRALAGRLPLPTPDPVYGGAEPHAGRLAFMGYRALPGEPLWRETLAAERDGAAAPRLGAQLGAFLRDLHGVAPGELGVDLPRCDGLGAWVGLYESFRDELFDHMRPDARARVAREFEAFLGEASNFVWRPALRHGDFGGGNLLHDPVSLTATGVLDWASAAIGDPAVDLAAVSWYGEAFMRGFDTAYPELSEGPARRRAEFYRSTHALQQALWALRAGDREEFEDGMVAYV